MFQFVDLELQLPIVAAAAASSKRHADSKAQAAAAPSPSYQLPAEQKLLARIVYTGSIGSIFAECCATGLARMAVAGSMPLVLRPMLSDTVEVAVRPDSKLAATGNLKAASPVTVSDSEGSQVESHAADSAAKKRHDFFEGRMVQMKLSSCTEEVMVPLAVMLPEATARAAADVIINAEAERGSWPADVKALVTGAFATSLLSTGSVSQAAGQPEAFTSQPEPEGRDGDVDGDPESRAADSDSESSQTAHCQSEGSASGWDLTAPWPGTVAMLAELVSKHVHAKDSEKPSETADERDAADAALAGGEPANAASESARATRARATAIAEAAFSDLVHCTMQEAARDLSIGLRGFNESDSRAAKSLLKLADQLEQDKRNRNLPFSR